jgi:hypothetical protein
MNRLLIDLNKDPHKGIIKALRSAPGYTLYEADIARAINLMNFSHTLRYMVRIGILEKVGRSMYRLNVSDPRLVSSPEQLRKFDTPRLHLCKGVIANNLTTGKEFVFESQSEAARVLFDSVSHTTYINRVVRGKQPQHKGYTFRYA